MHLPRPSPGKSARRWLLSLFLVIALLLAPACNRQTASKKDDDKTSSASEGSEKSKSSAAAQEKTKGKRAREVYAAWYDVPQGSLARRRAGQQELTAAHDRLPLGTLVRITHLENGKEVVVRITDRGINNRRVKIDLCKEAAEELEMVSKGIARVRMEVLPDEPGKAEGDALLDTPKS